MKKRIVSSLMLILLLIGAFGISLFGLVEGQACTVHFICETMNRGNQGSITFDGTTYYSGQSASYSAENYWIIGNPPSPTTDWFFYRWQVMWLGSQSWVDNQYDQSTWFHLRGEAYLEAAFYSPIQANSPLYPNVFYGEKQRVTGSARQYYSQQLSVCYYPRGSGYGPGNPNGLPPFGCPGGAGYGWTTVTVTPSYPGTWDTGLITPTIPLFDSNYQLPMTVDVFAGWAVGSENEVDSNVVSFVIDKAPVQIAAPTLTPSAINLGESISITSQIFSRYYINAGDMTGTWTVQAQLQGQPTWTDIASNTFTSVYGYSTIFGELGVFHDVSYSWTPVQAGTYNLRVLYTGNRLYDSQIGLSSLLTVGNAEDLGIVPKVQHKDTRMLCLGGFADGGCSLTGNCAWDEEHQGAGCDHDDMYCVVASASMINSYYGGHLSQDRIMYYIMRELNDQSSPEYQLGHGRGTETLDEIRDALRWALDGASIDYYSSKPTFTQIRNWIDSGRPILRRHVPGTDGHATVIDGYEEIGDRVHLINPADGTEDSVQYSTLPVAQAWVPPSSATARSDEFDLSLDSDGDGVIDFDETNRFLMDPNNPDSDGDLVFDKQEIISYTFLPDGTYDEADERRPDAENWGFGDGIRAELDIDSDNGGTTDGLEDLNRNGRVDPGETDPLDSSDDPLQAASVRIVGHSPINLLATDPNSRRVGYDSESQSVVNEIPGATYSGPGFEPQEIVIPNCLNGTYEVKAIGMDTGPYTISVESLDSNGSLIDSDSWDGNALPDEEYCENMTLEPDGRLILPHDIEVTNLLPFKILVGQEHYVNITVTVENQGNFTESSNLTIYYNVTAVILSSGKNYTTVTLTSGNFKTLTLTWNTTGVAKGNYTIKAEATPVPGEIDTADNTFDDGWVVVTIPGDIDGDYDVDYKDLFILAKAYGSKIGDPSYVPETDINDDGKVNYKDLFILARNYGKET